MQGPEAAHFALRFANVRFLQNAKPLLDGVSFTVGAGGASVILGPNGAGKTLLLRLAGGLLTPTAGTVRWDNEPTRELMLQRPVLLRRSVRANIAFPLRVRGTPRAERAHLVARALSRTRLSALAARPARTLSAGEQQRLALARALVSVPRVLLLDEPASALDPGAVKLFESAIETLRADGVKIVMTTHDLAQARRLASEVLFLHRGRLLEQTPAAQFFDAPQSEAARKFLNGELLA